MEVPEVPAAPVGATAGNQAARVVTTRYYLPYPGSEEVLMGLADELTKLQKLKEDGVLSEDEFQQAKRKLLSADSLGEVTPEERPNEFLDLVEKDSSIGGAANRYVTYRVIMGVLGLIVFLIFSLMMFARMPHMP